MITKLEELLQSKSLNDAESLLRGHLLKAEIIDPSDDKSWAEYANRISFGFETNTDRNAFWERLLHFFKNDLEPKWGHLHKGHVFFWLGLTKLVEDVSIAKTWLEKALEEDRILVTKGGTLDIENAITNFSSYIMLSLIDRIEDDHFESEEEKKKFFMDLISPSFNAAIFSQEIDPNQINKSIKCIVPNESLKQAAEAKRELDFVSRQGLQIATISLAGSFLEAILLGILFNKYSLKTTSSGKNILDANLGDLFKEANDKGVFPSDSIKASCRIVHMFRNRLHPGNELNQKYKLTPRVANTVKNLLDSTLVDWSEKLAIK